MKPKIPQSEISFVDEPFALWQESVPDYDKIKAAKRQAILDQIDAAKNQLPLIGETVDITLDYRLKFSVAKGTGADVTKTANELGIPGVVTCSCHVMDAYVAGVGYAPDAQPAHARLIAILGAAKRNMRTTTDRGQTFLRFQVGLKPRMSAPEELHALIIVKELFEDVTYFTIISPLEHTP